MKNSVHYACAVAVAVIIGPLAHGGTISTSSTDMSAFSAGATFRMSVNSGGNIAANTGFTTPTTSTSGQSFLLTISPGQEPGPGATLTSATLDLSRLASPTDGTLTTVMSGTGGTVGSFRPTFGSIPSTLFVSISAPLGGTMTFTAPGVTGITAFDLLPVYGGDILAGNDLTINWLQTDTFTANTSGYVRNNWKNAVRTFGLTQSMNAEVQGVLNAAYVLPVPEPATWGMLLPSLAFGLFAAIRKHRSTRV
jgi:hypothetical protein